MPEKLIYSSENRKCRKWQAGHSRKRKKNTTWTLIDYSGNLINGSLRKAYGTIKKA
jgi:hypothetical protein